MLGGYISLFTDEELNRIYQASLDILFTVGIKVSSDEILGIMKNYGALVDEKKQVVRFPQNLVEEVAKIARRERDAGFEGYAPGKILWWAPSTVGDAWQVHAPETDKVGFGDATPFYYDWTGKTKRAATRRDLINMIKLAEVLEEVDCVTPILAVSDVPGKLELLYNYALTMEYTSKKIICGQILSADQIKYLIKLAEIYSGVPGDTQWVVSAGDVQYNSPLSLGVERCRNMLEAAKLGLKWFSFGSGAVSGLNAPVTRAGTIALATAEILGGWVIAKAINKDSILMGLSFTGAFDMRTGRVSFSCPEAALQDGGIYQLFRRLFNKSIATGHGDCIDAKTPGFQAIQDKISKTITWGALTTRYTFHFGILDQASTFSPTQLMLDLELNKAIRQLIRGVEVNDETICLDLIEEIGHADKKKYLTARHTLKNYKEVLWIPELIDRTPYQGDKAEREKENLMLKSAEEKWRKALKRYQKPKLPGGKKKAIKDILKRAEKELCK